MCSPRKSNDNFLIFTFYESKQMSLTQDLKWSLGRSIALQLQRQTDLLLCTVNCFLQWDHLPNMAVGDLAFYYTLYLWFCVEETICDVIKQNESELTNTVFKIQSNKADSFLLFVQSFNCLYLWNQLLNLCGIFTKLKPKQYLNRKCWKTKIIFFDFRLILLDRITYRWMKG